MKTYLLHGDRDVDWDEPFPPNAEDLITDLGLATLIGAMAGSDKRIPPIATKALLRRLGDVDSILYRQGVLRDCLAHPSVVRTMYELAGEAIENESRNFWGLRSRHAASILRRSTEVLRMFFGVLRKLRAIAEGDAGAFESEGFARFFAMLRSELDDAYLQEVYSRLRSVEFRGGMLITAHLGRGNRGTGYVLRNFDRPPRNWFDRFFLSTREPGYTYQLHPRDESGARALSELGDRGVNLVADALAQSCDHILAFFTALRDELAFYVGCINLHERLAAKGEPICFPVPHEPQAGVQFSGLYDACLALSVSERVVGNDADARGKMMVIITGANQGGKSTFLRSLGIAQLMMECGMFVAADAFRASLCNGLFTHYKREEDAEMESGKFDEELRRMSALADRLSPGALVLFNESFAATNEREGSEIARQITEALVDAGVRIAFVTHLYEYARKIWEERRAQTLFLRADRRDDGQRTFKLREGEPLPTSYGEDIYGRVFGAELARSASQPNT